MLVIGSGEASNHVLPLLYLQELLDCIDLNETAAIKDYVGR